MNYTLYGSCLIENDATMKDFAMSLIKIIPDDDLIERSKAIEEDGEDSTYKDKYMDRVREFLEYDLSRTDIDYENLMYKYSCEIGPVLYEMDNHGISPECFDLVFFGSGVDECFNNFIYYLILLLKFCDNKVHPYFCISDIGEGANA